MILNKKAFSLSKGINPSTVQYYAQKDVSKMRKFGGRVGKIFVAVILAA